MGFGYNFCCPILIPEVLGSLVVCGDNVEVIELGIWENVSFSEKIETKDWEFCKDSLLPFTISNKSRRVHKRYCRDKYFLSPLILPT